MEALEAAAPPRAADAVVDGGAVVAAGRVAGELTPHAPLLVVAGREACGEPGLDAGGFAPALDPSGGLEPRDGGDEMPAGEVVRGGERLAVHPVGALLGDGRSAEGAADRDSPERARLASQLTRYELSPSRAPTGWTASRSPP